MNRYGTLLSALVLVAGVVGRTVPSAIAEGGELLVVGVRPAPRTIGAPVGASIRVVLDRAVDRSTVTGEAFSAFGRWSGPAPGTFSFANQDRTVILRPSQTFSAGEQVMVVLSNQIRAADGSALRSAGYSFQFWTRSAPSTMRFGLADVMSTRSIPSEHTQSYGGVATDLNNDGWLDLTIVNEITADLRVFLNRADGSGLFNNFIEPTFPVGDRASPSEASDFNGDGNPDLAVANIDANSVSIVLGNGDGTFAPQQEVPVGQAPRGIAVLDADGDGDADIVNTNSYGAGSLSLLVNDGSGVFGRPVFFEGGWDNEWALAAADMNEDGILDLVVGAQDLSGPAIVVNLGNGDGTFTFASSQSAGGAVWMLNTSDVNGDGHDDVVTANSLNNNGAILLGDGVGGLAAPTLVPLDPFPLATDLGDVDGDGDLDWATSSYSGDWWLLTNDGQGQFTLAREFPSTSAASCALFFDSDNDGDLDLALIDEVADQVLVIKTR